MPPRNDDGPILALLGRILEALLTLISANDGRSGQIRGMMDRMDRLEQAMRDHLKAEEGHGATAAALAEELRISRTADEAALAKARAEREVGGLALARFASHPATVAILSALLAAIGMWFGVRPTPAPVTPPAHTAPPAEEAP